MEHIALEIQTLAGMDTGFGRTRGTEAKRKAIYYVVFSYMEEDAGVYAAKAAVRIAQALIEGADYDLAEDIQQMREIREDTRLGPIPPVVLWKKRPKEGFPLSGSINKAWYNWAMASIRNESGPRLLPLLPNIAVDIACDKEETKMLLEAAEIPVPRGTVVRTEEGLDEAIEEFGYPIVIKPIDGNHGKGNTTNITNWEQAIKAFEAAKDYGRSVIVERFITGFDFRMSGDQL